MATPTATQTGKADFQVGSNTYQTWYKIVGDLNPSNGSVVPMVMLHGGPGMSHHYMLPHQELYTRAGIPVIFYDQLGNGESTHLEDAPPEFWTPELFMDELDNLLTHLRIRDNFDLFGQSWGGMLAGQYASTRAPPGLKRLLIANAPSSMSTYAAGTRALLGLFPPHFASRVLEHEKNGTTQDKEYQDAAMQFAQKHVCTVDPWPVELVKSFEAMEICGHVYAAMMGVSEFNITGSLRTWSIVNKLHQISVPTLFIGSPNDSVQEATVLPWFQKVPKIKWVQLQNSTHLAVFEEPEKYFQVILEFLESVPLASP